ncbi:ABC transporter substrate-binding protein [Acetivibrio cellulolyticus]|uniref:ABC transporter substrate-binding protein n=1 Tax=Acetivibrio cellulolyticus TaxID=35830 RepID=UPI0001E2E739|nr:ABC transporter substrate-binding protein [Acetivibrio cellulolyticus]
MGRSTIKIKLCVLILLCITILFAACDQNLQSNGTLKQNDSSSPLPEYEIVWYHMNTPQKDSGLVLEEVNKYLKKKINARLKLELIDFNNYDKEIKSVISSGQKFDLCFTSAWINSYVQNSLKGSFVELDTLLEKYGKGILERSPKVLLDGAKVNGKIYAVPSIKELGHQFCITLNKKYVQKYGFDISSVSELEDLEPMFQVIKENEPDVVPYLICAYSCSAFSMPMERIDEQVPSALYFDNRTDYKLVNTFETPEFQQYAALMHKWYKKAYILQDAATIKSIAGYEKTGNWFVGASAYNPRVSSELSNRLGYDVVTVPLRQPFITKKDIEYHMQAISSTSEDPERVMMFLELLNTDKYLYNLLGYGIEGIHYKKVSENVIDMCGNGYSIANHTYGNSYLAYSMSYYPKTLNEDFKDFDSRAIISPLLEFNFDPTPVESEIAKITEVTEEVEAPVFVGAVDPKIYIPKVIEKYKKAGLDKVMDEQQRQIDQWISKKSGQ